MGDRVRKEGRSIPDNREIAHSGSVERGEGGGGDCFGTRFKFKKINFKIIHYLNCMYIASLF